MAATKPVEKVRVRATVNGEPVDFLCEPQYSLLQALRDSLGLTGAKEGCNDGNCGACSVLLDGRLVNSCLVLAVEVDGCEILTVEGLAEWPALHPLQRAFIAEDALQCGFCTPGVLMASKALLDQNPDPSDDEIRKWLAGNLCRCTGYETIVRAVRAAAAALRGHAPAPEPAAPSPGFAVIGARTPRYDAAEKVTGRALFAADVRLPTAVTGLMLRSPYAHARIRGLDLKRAEALPGVLAVATAADLPPMEDVVRELGEGVQNARYARDNTFASDKVLYQGHAIAAVAATTPEIAERALGLIKVDYEALPAVVDVLEAAKPGAPLLHDHLVTRDLAGGGNTPTNVAEHIRFEKGDPEAGFREAEVVVEREFRTSTVHQGYIEPQSVTASWGPDGTVVVYATTQGSFDLRDQIAELLRLPLTTVRVVPTEVGGAFGGKNRGVDEVAAVLLSRKCGRPVKMSLSRAEVLLATSPSPGLVLRVKMAARRSGRIVAAAAELYCENGAYPSSMVGSPMRNMFAPYDIPHCRCDGYDVVVNKPQMGSYRAPQTTPGNFAAEQVVDELAQALGMDPIALRLLNSAAEGTRRVDGVVLTAIGARQVLEAAAASAHYNAPLEGPHRGRGVAHGFWGNWGAQSSAVMSVNADGTVALTVSNVDVSGTRTTLAMQAAEALGLPLERIKPRFGDTESTGFGNTSAGSRTTVACGLAVIKAAGLLLAELKQRAAAMMQSAEAVEYRAGTFATATARLTFAEVAAASGKTGGPVTAAASVAMPKWGASFGTHIADVEVDPDTGKVKVLRYTVVQDVGRAVNPTMVEGQLRGGATQGIGWGLYEGYVYDDKGRLLNPSLLDNKLPTIMDVPPIETILVEVPVEYHPYGIRGVGEMPIVPPPAALANAVARAIGARVQRLPMTPARVLEARGIIEG